MILDHDDIEAIAAAVVKVLEAQAGEEATGRRGLATAADVAELLGVHKSWVYANQRRIGGIRLGTGPKARLRFDVVRARDAFEREREAEEAERRCPGRPRKSAGLPPGVQLLTGKGGDQGRR